MPKWALANSMDLYLYPRHFEPLFRGFFGKAARFRSRQNVEFRPAFLLVLPNTHSKHRYQRVSQLCDVSDVKTAGKPPPASGRNHGVLAMLGREKAKHPLPAQRVVAYRLALSRASVFNVTPISPCGLRGYPDRAATETSARSEYGSDRMQRVHSRADGAAPGDSAHV